MSPSLPAGVGAVFLEFDLSYRASLSASEADKLRASLRASGAAVLLPRRVVEPDPDFHVRGVDESESGLGGALDLCLEEASIGVLARRRPPWFVRAKDGKVVRLLTLAAA